MVFENTSRKYYSSSYHLSLRPLFCLFLSCHLRQVLLYNLYFSFSLPSGDFFKDKNLPPADLFVLCHVTENWSDEHNHCILEKVYRCLPPGTCPCADPEGGTGGPDPRPLKKSQNIGFLTNTGPDPCKTTKLPSQHSMFGHHWPASETPFKWHFTGGPMLAH